MSGPQQYLRLFGRIKILLLLILAVTESGCTTDEIFNQKIHIEAINFEPSTIVNFYDTLLLEGTLMDPDNLPNCVNLFVNGKILDKQKQAPYKFCWIVGEAARLEIQLEAEYPSGMMVLSDTIKIFANSRGVPDGVELKVNNSQEEWPAYQDEDLILTIVHPGFNNALEWPKKITMYVDDQKIGSTYKEPFSFALSPIGEESKHIYAVVTDKHNQSRHYSFELKLAANKASDLAFTFNSTELLSTGTMVAISKCNDDQGIKEFQVFHDGESVHHEFVEGPYPMGFREETDKIKVGTHHFQSMAIDHRNDTTFSELYSYEVFQNFILDEEIIEGFGSQYADLAFVLTQSKLYLLDPLEGEIRGVHEIPLLNNATAMDYISETGEVCISGENQRFLIFDCNSKKFTSYFFPGLKKISDFEFDHLSQTAFVLNEDKLHLCKLAADTADTADFIQWEYSDIGAVGYDNSRKLLLVGGKSDRTGSVYKYRVYKNNNGILEYREKSDYFLNSFSSFHINEETGLFFHENNVSRSIENVNEPVTSYEDTRSASCFNTDGKLFYTYYGSHGLLRSYDSWTGEYKGAISIPQHTLKPDMMFTNVDDSFIICLDNIVFKDRGQISFIPENSVLK